MRGTEVGNRGVFIFSHMALKMTSSSSLLNHLNDFTLDIYNNQFLPSTSILVLLLCLGENMFGFAYWVLNSYVRSSNRNMTSLKPPASVNLDE